MELPKACFIGDVKRRQCFKFAILQVIDWKNGIVKITPPEELKPGMEFIAGYIPEKLIPEKVA